MQIAISEQDVRIDSLQTDLQALQSNSQKNTESLNGVVSATSNLDGQVQEIEELIAGLKSTIVELNLTIEDLQSRSQKNAINIQENADLLSKTRGELSSVKRNTHGQLQSINHIISRKTLHWIAATLSLTLIVTGIFLFLRRKLASSTDSLNKQIRSTKESLEAEAVKLDSKLLELLERKLETVNREQVARQSEPDKLDHSLGLKVGEEIHRMRNRIDNMPSDTKGIGALTSSLKRLEEQFNDNGYELVNLLGKAFVDGLTVDARFVPSDDLRPGEQIITKVIKPQINHNGVLLRAAEVEVSTGG